MNKNNGLMFDKRMDIHRKYRNVINKESMSLLDPYLNDQRLNNQKKEINSIDSNILKPINIDIKLSEGKQVEIDFSKEYKMLLFDLNDIDKLVINSLNEQLDKMNAIRSSNFILDNNMNIKTMLMHKYDENVETLNSIAQSISDLRNRIQIFPKTARQDLEILEQSLKLAKSKKDEPIRSDIKVDITKVDETKDWKKFYFVSLYLGIGFLVVAIILVVLLLVL